MSRARRSRFAALVTTSSIRRAPTLRLAASLDSAGERRPGGCEVAQQPEQDHLAARDHRGPHRHPEAAQRLVLEDTPPTPNSTNRGDDEHLDGGYDDPQDSPVTTAASLAPSRYTTARYRYEGIGQVAFYGRCSTEDNQDPQTSHAWQGQRAEVRRAARRERSRRVLRCRSVALGPVDRRDAACRLLAALKDLHRGWHAVVVGEGTRCWFGNQFSLVAPRFDRVRGGPVGTGVGCERGVGTGATAYGVPIPMPALRQS